MVFLPPEAVLAETCPPGFTRQVLASAKAERAITLPCTLSLSAGDTIEKRIIIENSDVRLYCNGAVLNGGQGTPNAGKDMLEIRSRRTEEGWRRPENVEIDNCRIVGSVRIHGMAPNGEGPALRESSRLTGHVERARAAAPRRVAMRNLFITGTGRIPLYIAPGVSEVSLIDSTVTGVSKSTAIYLDAESTMNVITSNRIAVDTQREIVAIDGSSYNQINNNDFYKLGRGGIFLYRNCGEGGTIRHSTPSNNRIVGNRFHYEGGRAAKPAIYLGSRDGWRTYCSDDGGYNFGSSADNRDFATQNVVTDNEFNGLEGGKPIQTGSDVNRPNQIQN